MNGKKKNLFYENRFVILSFILTAVIMCTTYILRHVYPFGDQIVLKVDLYHQYAPFHEELRSRIVNGQSLIYSWEGGLGKEFITQVAYYTASPISILILLFNQEFLPEALAIFILLKTCFSAAFFSYYLRKHFDKNDISVTVFGLLYAFTAFMTGYYWNVMWLDTVAIFPLVALGIERLIHENKHTFYLISLVFTMIVNFYMAVIVCVFSALYYLVVLFSEFEWKRNKDIIISRSVKFAIVSIIAALISMFILAPVAIALSQTATSDTNFPAFEFYDNVYQLITNHFIGARPVVLARNEDLPNVYSGVVTMMLIPLYFFNNKIPRKEKTLIGLLLAFMLLCACIKPLDYMIHGFHFPSNLPHRYTFIYSFIMLTIAYKGLVNIKTADMQWVVFAGIFYVIILLLTEYVLVPNISDIDRVLSDSDMVINIIAIIVYAVLINIYKGTKPAGLTSVMCVFFVFVIAECLFSSYEGLDRTTSRNEYVQYIENADKAVDYLDQKENGNFYRTEFRRFTTINDAALYHYRGFSQFSSLAPGGISEFIGHLGIAATGNSYRYYDPTALVDAMFDLKYVMNKAADNGDGTIRNERYEKEKEFGNVWIYRNDRVLPLGFMVNKDIENWETTESMPFRVQNDFVKLAAGIDEEMFTDIQPDSITKTYMEVTDEINSNEFKYKLTDPANLSLLPTVTTEFTSDKDQYLFVYVDAGNAKRVKYRTDTANEDRELSAGKSLFDIGHVKAGEKITVTFELTNKGEFEKTYRKDGTVKIYGASYHDEVFQKAYDKLKEHPYNITSFEDTDIEGTVNAAEDGILFTSIPYIGGWRVTLDGKPVDKVSIGDDGVIGVEVPAGEHKINFRFTSKGLVPSVIVSFAGILLAVIYNLIDKKKRKKAEEKQAQIKAHEEAVAESIKAQKAEERKNRSDKPKKLAKKGRK